MKISKILKIKNVGRFYNFSSRDDNLAFKEDNVIFAYNTNGKSTLTSILKSLQSGNKNLVYGRKTFGSTEPQEISLCLDGEDSKSNISFSGDSWKLDQIEIFDNNFIHNNVFYGDEIGQKQRSNLYNVFLGNNVKELLEKIAKETESLEKRESLKEGVRKEYRLLGMEISIEDFLQLKDNSNVQQEIKKAEEKLKLLSNSTNIQDLKKKSFLYRDFDKFSEIIDQTLDTSIAKKIEDHIKENLNSSEGAFPFLQRGITLMKEGGNCVFCSQEISSELAKELLYSYKGFFNEEYNILQRDIKNSCSWFLEIDLEKEILKFSEYGVSFSDINIEEVVTLKKNLDKQINKKREDLNYPLNSKEDKGFIVYFEILRKAKSILDNLDIDIIGEEDIENVKKEISSLRTVKLRFEEPWRGKCKQFNKSNSEISKIKEKIDSLNTEVKRTLEETFQENQDDINFFLDKLGANFHLDKLEPKQNMGMNTTHFCSYEFLFEDEHSIKISNKERQGDDEPDDKQSFGNTLSDSDRRILAFAFFLSKLKNDKHLSEKIVVFDDPFSSLDENRRETTVLLIENIMNKNSEKPAQKIILTHDAKFLCMCKDKMRDSSREKKFLKIDYIKIGGSKIVSCDVENDFIKEKFIKDIEYIKSSIERGSNLDEALKKVRPCLEHLLKEKYYFDISPESLNDGSINKYLEEIGDKCPVGDEIIEKNWHREMHDSSEMLTLNDPEKVSKLKEALSLLERI